MGGQHVVLNEIVSGSMKLVRPALRDLIEDDSPNSVLGGEGGGADLHLAYALECSRIRILAMRKRGRSSVSNHVAVWQVAIDRHYLTGIRGTLLAGIVAQIGAAAGTGQQDREVLPVLRYLRQRHHGLR